MKEIFGGSFSLAGTGNIVSKIPIYIYNDFEIIFNYICGFVMTYMKEVAIFEIRKILARNSPHFFSSCKADSSAKNK